MIFDDPPWKHSKLNLEIFGMRCIEAFELCSVPDIANFLIQNSSKIERISGRVNTAGGTFSHADFACFRMPNLAAYCPCLNVRKIEACGLFRTPFFGVNAPDRGLIPRYRSEWDIDQVHKPQKKVFSIARRTRINSMCCLIWQFG